MANTECTQCGAAMPLLARRHARTCSPRCRKRASRARQAAALPPVELRERRRWVRRAESKAPLRANCPGALASVVAPSTWSSYEEAATARHGAGLGFVLAEGDGIVCIDLDHCLTDGRLAGWAREIVDRCPATFVEVSPSGTGLHIWGRGRLEQGRRIRRADGAHIEVYGQGRYIAMSGRRYGDAPRALADLTEVIASLT